MRQNPANRKTNSLAPGDKPYQRMILLAMREDPGIATLVELHDQIIDQDNGYWVKIEAWQVAVS